MPDSKTFRDSDRNNYLNPIYSKQQESVAKMRTELLASTDDNAVTLRHALQNITAMRIYHQMTRIIKYTELMDKLEEKLYQSIEDTIDSSSSADPTTWIALLGIQERLQKNMVESHKLLQPYLNVQEFSVVDLMNTAQADNGDEYSLALPAHSRDNIRIKAQAILSQLEIIPGD